jgi:hypothetical protein
MFGMMRPFMPPPPEGVGSPFTWGTREHVEELLGDSFDLEFEDHDSVLAVPTGEDYWELFSTSYGPTKTAATTSMPNVARSSTRRGSTSSRNVERATRWSITASTC